MATVQVKDRGRFRTTHWALVQSAGQADGHVREQAFEQLLVQYLPALKDFLISKFRVDQDYADDLVQGFVLEKMIKKQLIAQACRARGKFRTFLLTAICNFVISEMRQADAQKRIPKSALVSLSDLSPETLPAILDPEVSREFDLAFTRQVLSEAVKRMRLHCERIRRKDLWEVFENRILAPAMDGVEPEGYESLIQRFQFRSPSHASNVLMSAKRIFARILKSVVAEYARNGAEIEEELGAFRAILAK